MGVDGLGPASWGARAPVQTGRDGPEASPPSDALEVDKLVDRVLESHRVVLGALDDDLAGRPAAGFGRTQIEPAEGEVRRRFAALESEPALLEHRREAERLRRERERTAREFQPRRETVRLDPPIVTRGGILYVPPAFEQAPGFDRDTAARLARLGYRSVAAFLRAPSDDLAGLLGLPIALVERAQRDLDLTRLPQVDEATADLLRLAGYATVRRIAVADPDLLGAETERLVTRHRLARHPPVLASAEARRRLVAAAEARSG